MSKRSKPNPVIVADLRQAEGALAEMAMLDRRVADIEIALNAAVDAAKAAAQRDGAGLLARRKELADAVATFATLNKGELFRERRSLELAFGLIGFRQSTQLVQQLRVTQGMTLEKLHEYGFLDAVRVKEEIDKDAMSDWPDERLELVGMKRRQSDTFYIEIKAEEVAAREAS